MNYKIINHAAIIPLVIIFMMLLPVSGVNAQDIDWQVVSSGGVIDAASTGYRLSATVGQTAIGSGFSTDYSLSHGFWQYFGEPGCCDLPGDANNNGAVNILDVTYLISYLYKSGPPPPCPEEGDANGNGATNILDATYLISYLYKSGPAPICP
nr:dockerin type I repeat-containing protein [candidate division Zixibacteria bacterium]